MGATTAIAVGLSGLSGVTQLAAQNRQARAQKKLLDAQAAQQKLQADLQLFALNNQRVLDSFTNALMDRQRELQRNATETQLIIQQQLNDLGVANALFAANVNLQKAALNRDTQQIQAKTEAEAARQQFRQQVLAMAQTLAKEEGTDVQSAIQTVAEKLKDKDTLSAILDTSAAFGGVNEALALLAGQPDYTAIQEQSQFERNRQLNEEELQTMKQLAAAGISLADFNAARNNTTADLAFREAQYNYALQQLDASTSGAVGRNIIEAQRAANQGQYTISSIVDQVQRASKYLQQKAAIEALQKGQQLSADTIAAQKAAIPSPGLFDYLGVGINTYRLYNALAQEPIALQAKRSLLQNMLGGQ